MRNKVFIFQIFVLFSWVSFAQNSVLSKFSLEFSVGKQYCFNCGVMDIPRHVLSNEVDFIFHKRPVGNYLNAKLQFKTRFDYLVFLFQKTGNYSYITGKIKDNDVYFDRFPFYTRYEYYGLLYKMQIGSGKFYLWAGPVYMAFFEEMMSEKPYNFVVSEWEIFERSPYDNYNDDLGINVGASYRLWKFQGWDLLAEANYFYNITSAMSETLSLGLTFHLHFKKDKK